MRLVMRFLIPCRAVFPSEANRRSVYILVRRNTLYAMLESFDMPDQHKRRASRLLNDSGCCDAGSGSGAIGLTNLLEAGPNLIDLFHPNPSRKELSGQALPASFGKPLTAVEAGNNTSTLSAERLPSTSGERIKEIV